MNIAQRTILNELLAAQQRDDNGNAEALFRPSSIDRLIGCPGSIVLSSRMPKLKVKSTEAQLEGSAAHKVAEEALRGVRQPDEWSDRMVRINDLEGLFVDEEMIDGVGTYLDEIRSRQGENIETLVEYRLSLAPLDPSDPLFAENRGTGDCVLLDRRKRKITIVDLKYGKGVMVPGDSPQLKNYALTAFVTFGMDGGWSEIETCVVQPRAFSDKERVKPVSFAPMDLLDSFLPELAGAMEASLDRDAHLVPGKWCRWCPANHACPAVADQALNLARDAFAAAPSFSGSSAPLPVPAIILDAGRGAVPPGAIALPSPLDIDPGDIATLMDRFDLYDAFKKAVQQRAAAMLQSGISIPGWDLEARSGNRRWKSFDAVPEAFDKLGATGHDTSDLLRTLGLKTSDMYTDPKLKSPAQMEKILPKDKRGFIEFLVERPPGEPTLVRSRPDAAKQPLQAALGPYKVGDTGA